MTLPTLPQPALYFPITGERYSTRAGLSKFGSDFGNKQQDQQLFQLDSNFTHYRNNKLKLRDNSIDDHICTDKINAKQLSIASRFILQHLCSDHPQYFEQRSSSQGTILNCKLTDERINITADYNLAEDDKNNYLSLFDALAMQVQEDICIMSANNGKSILAAAHLCAANHWSARNNLNMDMFELHQRVPDFIEENREPNKLLIGLHNKQQAYVRFAWGINEQPILNQHTNIKLKKPAPKDNKVWMRIERQTLRPIPNSNMLLFTIRTYFRDCASLKEQQRSNLITTIDHMSKETLEYKNINKRIKQKLRP